MLDAGLEHLQRLEFAFQVPNPMRFLPRRQPRRKFVGRQWSAYVITLR